MAGLKAQPTAAQKPVPALLAALPFAASKPVAADLTALPFAANKPVAAGLTALPFAANKNAACNRTSFAFCGRTVVTARKGRREGPTRHALHQGAGFGAVASPNRRALVPVPIYFGPRRTNALLLFLLLL